MARNASPKTLYRLVRFTWRYRGQIEQHRREYSVELATTLRTTLDATLVGRLALTSYRFAMRMLLGVALSLAAFSVLVMVGLHAGGAGWWSLVGLLLLLPAGWCAWQWTVLGAALRWLDEHADTTRTVSAAELPGRLRALAAESRQLANVPARLADDLDETGTALEETGVGS